MPTIFKEATTLPLLLTVYQCINTFTRVLGEREKKRKTLTNALDRVVLHLGSLWDEMLIAAGLIFLQITFEKRCLNT